VAVNTKAAEQQANDVSVFFMGKLQKSGDVKKACRPTGKGLRLMLIAINRPIGR